MKHYLRLFATCGFLLPLAGCAGESFDSLFHEAMVIHNELADEIVFIKDEQTAETFVKDKLQKIKDRWENLKSRTAKWLDRSGALDPGNPKGPYDLGNMFIDHIDEYGAIKARLSDEEARLKGIRSKLRHAKFGDDFVPAEEEKRLWPKLGEAIKATNDFRMSEFLPVISLVESRGGPQQDKIPPGKKPDGGKGLGPPKK
jgi:hypothetical protein